MKSGIYKITNIENGKRYVGSAIDISKRWARHTWDLTNGVHHSKHLQRSWDTYGPFAFRFEVIEYYKRASLLIREQYYLDLYNSANPDYGYNINPTAGSNLGKVFSLESRKKMSLAKVGKPCTRETSIVSVETRKKMSLAKVGKPSPQKGSIRSEETRRKISDSNTNPSAETRKKMSLARKGKVGHNTGHIVTTETREKISLSKKGKLSNRKNYACSQETKDRISESKRTLHTIENGIETKYCSICNKWLDLTAFNNDKTKWDKLVRYCRVCITSRIREKKQQKQEAI